MVEAIAAAAGIQPQQVIANSDSSILKSFRIVRVRMAVVSSMLVG
jgi:hypothetical protein